MNKRTGETEVVTPGVANGLKSQVAQDKLDRANILKMSQIKTQMMNLNGKLVSIKPHPYDPTKTIEVPVQSKEAFLDEWKNLAREWEDLYDGLSDQQKQLYEYGKSIRPKLRMPTVWEGKGEKLNRFENLNLSEIEALESGKELPSTSKVTTPPVATTSDVPSIDSKKPLATEGKSNVDAFYNTVDQLKNLLRAKGMKSEEQIDKLAKQRAQEKHTDPEYAKLQEKYPGKLPGFIEFGQSRMKKSEPFDFNSWEQYQQGIKNRHEILGEVPNFYDQVVPVVPSAPTVSTPAPVVAQDEDESLDMALETLNKPKKRQ